MRRNAVRTHAASALPPRDVWTLLTDGILLLCAVLGTCYAVLTAYRLPPGGTPLLAVCLVSTLVSLSIFSMPRKGWIPLLILVLLGGAAVRRLWGILLIGLQAIGLQIYQILADNLWFLAPLPFPLPVPDPGTEAAVALTLLFLPQGWPCFWVFPWSGFTPIGSRSSLCWSCCFRLCAQKPGPSGPPFWP